MIVLDSTRSLEVVLGGPVATRQLPIVATYVDFVGTSHIPGASHAHTNGATPVTAVPAPPAGTDRHVHFLAVRNEDTATNKLAVRHGLVTWSGLLKPGDSLLYSSGEGFQIVFTGRE